MRKLKAVLIFVNSVLFVAKTFSAFVEEEMTAGASFTPVIKDVRAFEDGKKHHSPFYEAIITEGVQL